jgi:hypothetical protein
VITLPGKSRRKKPESLEQKLKAIIIRIPITSETIAAALYLIAQIVQLATVVKIPLQVEKVATLEPVIVTPAQIESAAAEIKIPTAEELK